MDPAYIDVDAVSMRFGTREAVREVSLSVPRGTIFGLVGSDGAGKSTLLRMVATMIRPVSGSITLDGIDAIREKNRIKPLIGYMPQRFGLYPDLTVEENLDFFMQIFGIPRREWKERKERYLGFSNLLPFLDRQTGRLSGGMKQKLGLACVLVHEPQALILDEPTNGVDPVSRREFWEILDRMRDGGMTILVSTAYLDEGEWCDRLGLMHRAQLLAVETPDALRGDHPDLEEAIITRIQAVDRELADDAFKH
ncbi:MAG: ABC transporter ATP-binding protein [Syntrophales bacterium]|jgi:ABC-2 type transport system ATP-binding protein|nr:ABC transporter ATP-binding protein [Syntrophales bacterium]MCK9528918.1 ABC transporter ATP-binding protein [Syntrophales bacterium]MDX9922518.1 ABC transporter ATP-binding protein [Syntrophales bacterium]